MIDGDKMHINAQNYIEKFVYFVNLQNRMIVL